MFGYYLLVLALLSLAISNNNDHVLEPYGEFVDCEEKFYINGSNNPIFYENLKCQPQSRAIHTTILLYWRFK